LTVAQSSSDNTAHEYGDAGLQRVGGTSRRKEIPGLHEELEMNRQKVLRLLEAHKEDLSRRFGVTDMALFGSSARDTARADSDIDILVSFDGPATSARYFGAQFYLEDLLGRPVDLVTDKALRPELRPYVEREAIHV
jgi:hypothetical protein